VTMAAIRAAIAPYHKGVRRAATCRPNFAAERA